MTRPALATFAVVALAVASASAPVTAQDRWSTEAILASAADLEARVIEWRRDFHQNPELSNREFRTAGIVAEHLRTLGIEVTEGVAHTGVVGVLEGGRPGPTVLLRADMDALPVEERNDLPFRSRATGEYNGETVPVMHACGHDTHVAILMGVAEAMAEMRDDIPGTVKFVFQPAEEGAPQGEEGGAEMMVAEGVLEGVDAAFALHINAQLEVNTIAYRSGPHMAGVQDYRILVKGRQAHGAYPWMSVDPVVTASQIVLGLQTIVSRNLQVIDLPAVVTVGKIAGGVRSNIIPEEVEMVGTIRTFSDDDRDMVHRRIREIAENVATSMGAEAEVTIPLSTSYPVTANDPELTAAVVPSLERVAGAENVKVVNAVTGAEDFSYFSQEVPGFYFRLGGKPVGVPVEETEAHHTPGFFVDESGLHLGVSAMLAVALDWMEANGGG